MKGVRQADGSMTEEFLWKDYNYEKSPEFASVSKNCEIIDCVLPAIKSAWSFPNCNTFKLRQTKNLEGINYTSLKSLQRIDLSYRDPLMTQADIASNLFTFFRLIREVPQVQSVRIDVLTITLEVFTSLLLDNYQSSKISEQLEFRVDRLD